MRILIVADCYFPSTNSCAKLIRDLAVELVAQRHQVTVVVPDSNIDMKSQCALEEGVDVLRVRSGPIKGIKSVGKKS